MAMLNLANGGKPPSRVRQHALQASHDVWMWQTSVVMPKLDHGVEDNEHDHGFGQAKLEFKKALTSGVHDGEEDNERHGPMLVLVHQGEW